MSGREPIVIVGAGFGGLSAAIDLARRGEHVVVLEREHQAGGKARSVVVAGRTLDVGPTVLTMRWVFDELFEACGRRLDDAVTLSTPRVVARHAFGDGAPHGGGAATLDLFTAVDENLAAIEAFAGARNADGYRRFAERGAQIAELVRGPFLTADRPSIGALMGAAGRFGLGAVTTIDAHRTMWRALEDWFPDPRLRALFGRYATYVGSSPFLAPATLNVIAHVEREGVVVPEGGMTSLASAMTALAKDLGVSFVWGARVVDVRAKAGRASAVDFEHDGRRHAVDARAVIVNADVATLRSGALGPVARAATDGDATRPDGVRHRSLSAVTWALVGRASGFPLAHHNVFFSRDYPAEHRALFGEGAARRGARLADEPTVYVCAPDRGEGRRAGADERLFIIVNAPALGDRAPLSNDEVDRCEAAMFSVLSRAGLSIEPMDKVVATPSTFEMLAPGTGGALYGEASHGAFSALSRPSSKTKLRGLYIAGGSVHPGAGVPMAALSGRTTARLALSELGSTGRSTTSGTAGSISTP